MIPSHCFTPLRSRCSHDGSPALPRVESAPASRAPRPLSDPLIAPYDSRPPSCPLRVSHLPFLLCPGPNECRTRDMLTCPLPCQALKCACPQPPSPSPQGTPACVPSPRSDRSLLCSLGLFHGLGLPQDDAPRSRSPGVLPPAFSSP